MDTFTRREIFTTPRFLDFVGEEELTKQIGHPSRMWALVAVKELIDNAIDHAEEEGLPPQVEVEVTRRTITVADHGRGIPDEAIDGALDFAVRASSREAFVGPTRGAQGNALKTLFMMPHALGGEQDGLITVDTMGVRHGIRLGVDRIAQKPLIKRTREAGVVKTGGLVQIALPDSASWMPAADSGAIYNAAAAPIAELLERFALLNPHLAVTGRIDGWPLELSWRPTITDWKRWKPRDPLVAAWYTPDSFERLFCAQLNAERQRGRISFVRDFIGLFRGVSGTAKRKMVLADTGLAGKTLEALVDEDGKPDRSGLELLLYCLQEVGTAPKSDTLGIIGKEHLLERLGLDAKAREQFTYRLVTGTDPSSPTLTELAMTICEDGEDGEDDEDDDALRLLCGINHSPSLSGARAFEVESFSGYMPTDLGRLLAEQQVAGTDPLVVVAHHLTARPQFTNRGKSALKIDDEDGEAIAAAVVKISDPWRKQKEKELRDKRATLKRTEVFAKPPPKVTQKKAAAECMVEAYLKASTGGTLPAAPRQIMYAARDHIQRRSGKTLDSNYFSQTLLIDFVEANAELTKSWKIAWDARGNLILPHSHRRVPLSTLDVEAYIATKGWRDHYGAALFVEKEGFNPLFEEVQLGDRYDMAIMSTKGMSVTAARTLIDALVADGVRVFALRDFDVSGFTIAGTLGRNTRRHTWQTAGAVDLGLRLEDVEKYGLAKEAVQHKRGKVLLTSRAAILAFIGPNLRRNGAIEEEIEFLIRDRVELNAFTSGELVRCVEAKLDAAGVVKVTPREETLAAEAHEHAESIAEKQILAPLFAQLRAKHAAELEALTARLMAKPFKPAVAEFLERHRTADWHAALAHVVQGRA